MRKVDGYRDFSYKKNAPGVYGLLQKIGNEPLVEELEHPENLLNGI